VIYLDTGCLLKLYYPEPNSASVAAAVSGKVIVFTALHELETVSALQLKRFRREATPEQAEASMRHRAGAAHWTCSIARSPMPWRRKGSFRPTPGKSPSQPRWA